jgi:hypothetical protein
MGAALVAAASDGDMGRIAALLTAGADLSYSDPVLVRGLGHQFSWGRMLGAIACLFDAGMAQVGLIAANCSKPL